MTPPPASGRLSGRADRFFGTPADLLRGVRVERAADLLAEGAGTVTEVAYAVGFKSVSHFGSSFRDRFGETPSAYARQRASA